VTVDLPDATLWERAAAGDGEAFGQLFDRHSRAVYNHCFRLTASWSTAEDLTSATFLLAWRQRDRMVLANASLRPWLLAVATTRSGRTAARSAAGCGWSSGHRPSGPPATTPTTWPAGWTTSAG
jgi:hypothetical protein